MWKAALLAALWLPAAGPHGAHAMTLAELTKASAVFSDMIQKTLQITASAERRIGQANAEMDVQVRGLQLSPEEIQQVFGRVDGHLRTARAEGGVAKRCHGRQKEAGHGPLRLGIKRFAFSPWEPPRGLDGGLEWVPKHSN